MQDLRTPNDSLVSIIIPTYNRRHYIADAIESCLGQSHQNCEIIVVDDGSSDGTESFLRERYGDRIRYFYQDNRGPGIARNRGIAAANGEFIHFLDADDQLHQSKIEIGLDTFRQHPEVSVWYTHFQFVASDGCTPVKTPPFEHFSDDIFCELLRTTGCHILISSSMYRAEALRAVGGFANDPQFRSAEDWDLMLRLAAKFRFQGLDQRLVYRRMHNNMMSDDKLYGALGRLKTVENARHYGWERCMSPAEFDHKLAARHHVYALYLWQAGNRREARRHFLRAANLYQPEARQRRFYAFLTWFSPAQSMGWAIALAQWLRKLARLGNK